MPHFRDSDIKELFKRYNAKTFLDFIQKYDEQMVPVMKARGYQCIHSMERTVAFTFGEFTFKRKRWKKGTAWIVPVDEKLGLQKNTRFSWELLYQIARLATIMPYDKVVQVIDLLYGISITKPTVVKAVKLGAQLLEEQADYHYYEEPKEHVKEAVDVIYVEGDGVMIKAKEHESPNHRFDLTHFVVHTGRRQIGKDRFELLNKKEFINLDHHLVREQVLDYLYNTYDITKDTLLITNSDGGHGYTPYVFKELAKALHIKKHEHFWDAYHLNQKVAAFFKPYPEELLTQAQEALFKHDKSAFRLVLDSTESLLSTEKEIETFQHFKRKLLNNFQYTKPAHLRGLSHAGIGIMESQHRKVTYRMKNRGMYWTLTGAQALSQMILLVDKNALEDLFFGDWQDAYQPIKELNNIPVSDWLKESTPQSKLPTGKVHGLLTSLRD